MYLEAPLAVSWQITHRCNLRCTHCTDYSNEEPSSAACQSLIDDLGREKVFILSLTGGEPFVREDLVELVSRAHRWGMMTVIATNGIKVDPDTLASLRSSGTSAIAVSLDGVDAETHEAHRGPGTFDRARTALQMISDAGIHPILSVALDGDNVHQLRDIFDLAIRLKCERVKVQAVLHPRAIAGHIGYELALSRDQLQEVSQASQEVCSRLNDPEFVTYSCYTHYLGSLQHPQFLSSCPAGSNKVTIRYNGDVLLCDLMPASVIGNVWTNSLGVIWRSASSERALWQSPRQYGGTCSSCCHLGACKGGCLALSREVDAGVWNDPNCVIGQIGECGEG